MHRCHAPRSLQPAPATQMTKSAFCPLILPPHAVNRRLLSMSKTAAMKTSKALETPKAKAQGEVDYKAKIDVVIEAFSSKVTRGPAPCALLCLHHAS